MHFSACPQQLQSGWGHVPKMVHVPVIGSQHLDPAVAGRVVAGLAVAEQVLVSGGDAQGDACDPDDGVTGEAE